MSGMSFGGRWTRLLAGLSLILLLAGTSVSARTFSDSNKHDRARLSAANPEFCAVSHNVNKLVLAVNNNGTFGTGYARGDHNDCLTGDPIKSAEYPKGANRTYLFGAAFWVGAILGRDTLVSLGADGWTGCDEMGPDEAPFGRVKFRSITDPTAPEYEDAISEEDYIANYTDTLIVGFNDQCTDDADGRVHVPLNLAVEQRSYAWSYAYAEDFILFDYEITNIGFRTLEEVYLGVYVDGDVGTEGSQGDAQDDITGFLKTFTLPQGECEFEDTVDIAWLSDNDGDPVSGEFTEASVPHVTATRIVRTPNPRLKVSYNWWISNGTPNLDFGPRHKANPRDYQTGGRGTPTGDRNKYYVLSNGENDYDQPFTATITAADTLWETPPAGEALTWSRALDTRYLLSFGPFEVKPGDRLPISLAYVAGENFHQDPDNFSQHLAVYQPEQFYANLNFFDLAYNSRWADWIYDNPGVDTDGDGDSGLARYCPPLDTSSSVVSERIFYRGDGVPDFRGASPPPPPDVRVTGLENGLLLEWNGVSSETSKDAFSNVADFEGYRVYLSLDSRASSYSLLSSFDRENFNRWTLDPKPGNPLNFSLKEIPFTLDSLQELYGATFDPLNFSRNNPYRPDPTNFPDSVFYFEAQDYNVSDLGIETDIRKLYPTATLPAIDPTTGEFILTPDDTTDEGYIKYFEYELIIDSLLPTVAYWVSVTAFDFGSPVSGLPSLESAVTLGAISAYTDATAEQAKTRGLEVFVYPNPYLNEGAYLDRGFERLQSEGQLLSAERAKRITFQNLPPRARIQIFSLDGDLVRELEHDWSHDPTNPLSGRTQWDLITRNTQLAVSGLYYWTVENLETGEVQIGKLMLIM